MRYLCSHPVRADVRPDGTTRQFVRKTFDLMLCPDDDSKRQHREARSILRQIGHEPRNVSVGSPFNDAEAQPS